MDLVKIFILNGVSLLFLVAKLMTKCIKDIWLVHEIGNVHINKCSSTVKSINPKKGCVAGNQHKFEACVPHGTFLPNY